MMSGGGVGGGGATCRTTIGGAGGGGVNCRSLIMIGGGVGGSGGSKYLMRMFCRCVTGFTGLTMRTGSQSSFIL